MTRTIRDTILLRKCNLYNSIQLNNLNDIGIFVDLVSGSVLFTGSGSGSGRHKNAGSGSATLLSLEHSVYSLCFYRSYLLFLLFVFFVYFVFTFCLFCVYFCVYFLFTFRLLFVYFVFTFCLLFVYFLYAFCLLLVYFQFSFVYFLFTFSLFCVYFCLLVLLQAARAYSLSLKTGTKHLGSPGTTIQLNIQQVVSI